MLYILTSIFRNCNKNISHLHFNAAFICTFHTKAALTYVTIDNIVLVNLNEIK